MLDILVEATLRSIGLAAAVCLGLRIVRVQQPRLKFVAWTLVLATALVMPLAMRWHMVEIVAPSRIAPAAPILGQSSSIAHIAHTAIASTNPNVHRTTTGTNWVAVAQDAYLAIAIILLVRTITGLILIARIWQRARPVREPWAVEVCLRETTELATPVAFGSRILIPVEWREWDEAKRQIVLSHELAHVKWSDFYVQLASRIYCAIFWFSPLSWWLHKQLISLAEAASDDAALESTDPSTYAELLLYFGSHRQRSSIAVAMARPAMLSRRIERILLRKRLPAKAGWQRYTLFAACTLCAALLAAECSLQARSPNSEAGFWWQSNAKDAGSSKPRSGQPYVIVSGDSLTMSGSQQDAEQARTLRNRIRGEYIWFLHEGKAYVVTDAAVLQKAKALFKPQEELGRKQAELGAQQAGLGEQQARLGQQQADVSVKMPDLTPEIQNIQARIEELEKQMPPVDLHKQQQLIHMVEDELKNSKDNNVTQDRIGEYQSMIAELESHLQGDDKARSEIEGRIGKLQAQLGELQSQAGEEQSRLGPQQAALGEKQSMLGAEQSKLGQEQERLGKIAGRQMDQLLNESLHNGLAKPVP